MSAYLKLLDEAVNSLDVVRTRSRICNLLAEKNGLAGAEISKKVSLIADIFSAAGKNLFDVDNDIPLNMSLNEFDKGIARLNVNFSRIKVELLCKLKDALPASAPNEEKQNFYSPRASHPDCKYTPRPPLHSRTTLSTTSTYTIRGAAIGGVCGIAVGMLCHHVIASFFCTSLIGCSIGYALSKINKK